MKLKEKIKESTVLKLALALIVPGGLIVWGIYEYRKKCGGFSRPEQNPSKTKDSNKTT